MDIRRVVTGHDASGKAIVLANEAITPVDIALFPGMKTYEMWSTDGPRNVPHTGPFPGVPRYFPGPDGSVFRLFVFPPQGQSAPNPAALQAGVAEMQAKLPGLAEHLELDNPGMHTTDSVDYAIVVSGEIDLELDDGATVRLTPGCVVVQNGTRHAWRNRSAEPVVMAFILLGATYAVVTPLFEISDELWHYPMVKHLADGNGQKISMYLTLETRGLPQLSQILKKIDGVRGVVGVSRIGTEGVKPGAVETPLPAPGTGGATQSGK